jgi:hypothetical protein
MFSKQQQQKTKAVKTGSPELPVFMRLVGGWLPDQILALRLQFALQPGESRPAAGGFIRKEFH